MYPTKDEILQNLKTIDPETLENVKTWKAVNYTKVWSKLSNVEKISKLQELTKLITSQCKKTKIKFKITPSCWAINHNPEKPDDITFYMGITNPSIISTLHEIGHILYGSSELEACTYSVSLFKQIFEHEYTKLEWVGHMLVKHYNEN